MRYKYDRNEWIKASKMRVITATGDNLGVLTKEEALSKASEMELDLVLISTAGEEPVAKIMDWSKFKYTQSKKEKNKGKSVTIKEWWFKPSIEEHDIKVKLDHIQKFLKKGGKVKVTIKFVKRATYESMNETMQKVLELALEFAEKASEINKEGRNLSIFLKNK